MSDINPLPSNNSNQTVIIAVLSGVIITLLIVGGIFAYFSLGVPSNGNEEIEITQEEIIDEDKSDTEQVITYLESPKKVKNVDIFSKATDEYGYSAYDYQLAESEAFKFGDINGGKYDGGELIRMDVAFEGPTFNPTFVRLIKLPSGEKIVLGKYSSLDFGPDKNKYTLDNSFELAELEAPDKLTLGASNKVASKVEDMPAIFKAENKTVYYTDAESRKIYVDKDATRYDSLNGFYLKLADGSQASYEYKPRFIPENKIANITFANGTKNNIEYNYTSLNGCGSSNFIHVVDKNNLSTSTIVAKTSTGSDIYAPTLANEYLKNYYTNSYYEANGEKKSLQEFASMYPILFFEDPFDRVAVLTNAAFVPMAECGKPVIYLYPETTRKISVKVNPLGGFTYTEPNYERYGDGWNVIATPNSQIFEIEDKTKTVYPYLFWEGRGGIYKAPEVGFSVKKEEVDKFLSEKMTHMGFNSTEIKDFKEFWLPRMQEFPYYTVSFMGNSVMDQIAPLEISPKPDTVIRMLMDFKGHNKSVKIKEQRLPKGPIRKGFTVTEWGGVIQ